MIQATFVIRAAPTAIIAPRISSAPTMPQNRTRCWYTGGTANAPKIIAITKMLSTASDFSTRNPVRYLISAAPPSL